MRWEQGLTVQERKEGPKLSHTVRHGFPLRAGPVLGAEHKQEGQ